MMTEQQSRAHHTAEPKKDLGEHYDVRADIPKSPDTALDRSTLEREAREQASPSLLYEILDWAKYILLAVVVGLLITHFVAQRNEVVGSSMVPTLNDGDQLIVEKVSRLFGGLAVGDIITISGNKLEKGSGQYQLSGQDIVKRIIATAGQTVEIRDDMQVYIDGSPLEESYLPAGTQTSPANAGFDHLTVPEDHVFVLGDNRGSSVDSRYFGAVPTDAIHGEVWVRVYPFSRFGHVD